MMEKLKATFDADDRAVSPVIGVILMVAITVVLAAVIGTMVLGMGDNVQSNLQAGADTSFNVNNQANGSGSVDVTWNNNQNADHLEVKVVTDSSGSGVAVSGDVNSAGLSNDDSKSFNLTAVGDSMTVGENATGQATNVKLVITAVSADGEQRTVISEDSKEI